MNFSIRLSYPENNEFDWGNTVRQYAGAGKIELAFYSTELFLRNVKIEEVLEPFRKTPLEVLSVHMAHVNITDFPLFELVLDKTAQIAKAFNCDRIVVHPSKGELKNVSSFIEAAVDKVLSHEKIYLCWETFTSKKRFLSGINGIAEFCHGKHWHKACFDTSHVHDDQEVLVKQILKYLEYIKVFHISNRIKDEKIQHLPLFHRGVGDLDLDFLPILKLLKDKGFGGPVVLEYMPEFHSQLLEDIHFLNNKF